MKSLTCLFLASTILISNAFAAPQETLPPLENGVAPQTHAVFKGEKAMIAAVSGYPIGGSKLPGLVNLHGGGQYADYKACLASAKRGYATITIAWAGRINAPNYGVTPAEVKLFWDDETDDPNWHYPDCEY